MSGKRAKQGAAEPAPKAVAIGKPEDREPEGQTSLRQVGGAKSRVFNKTALNAALSALWRPSWLPEKSRHDQQVAALHAMMAFEPADEIEGMIAAQAVAMHYGAMECFRRAMIPEQPAEAAARLRKDGASLARGMVEMVAALDRKRGKSGSQLVRVDHVTVQAGGQAIVGNVAPRGPGGGAKSGTRQEPRAPPAGLARDAAQGAGRAALRRADPQRVPVPVPRDGERAVPDARRRQHRAAHRRRAGAHPRCQDHHRRPHCRAAEDARRRPRPHGQCEEAAGTDVTPPSVDPDLPSGRRGDGRALTISSGTTPYAGTRW